MARPPREYAVLMGTLALVLGLALKLWWLGLI
jgi:type IV secretion system protein TrbD